MSDVWKTFLLEQGARYAGDAVRDFGNPEAERRAPSDGNVLVDLSHLALIRASGADATAFLNGQLTNDVRLLDRDRSQLSAWCSPKGRMLAVFRIFRHADAYVLQLPAALRDDVTKRLRMYVLRAKVALENVDDAFVRFGVAGPDASSLVQDAVGIAPASDNAVGDAGELIVLRLAGAHPRFEVMAPPVQAPHLWDRLKRRATPAGADAWTWHDIAAGIPTVTPETSDEFVPQMANLELLGGVSFDKGCYTGQEIVARIHYRGRLKQRMYRAHVDCPAQAPRPHDSIYLTGQSTGKVVSAAAAPEDGYDMLAVIHIDSVAKGELRLGQPHGPLLQIRSLPYPITLPE